MKDMLLSIHFILSPSSFRTSLLHVSNIAVSHGRLRFQSFTALSEVAQANCLPSGEKATELMTPPAFKSIFNSPVRASQTFNSPSGPSPPHATSRPSGLKAIELTMALGA